MPPAISLYDWLSLSVLSDDVVLELAEPVWPRLVCDGLECAGVSCVCVCVMTTSPPVSRQRSAGQSLHRHSQDTGNTQAFVIITLDQHQEFLNASVY